MKFGVVMDPIQAINFNKDSSLDIMIEAQERGHQLFYMEPSSLYINAEGSHALMIEIKVFNTAEEWFHLEEASNKKLSNLDVIMMR